MKNPKRRIPLIALNYSNYAFFYHVLRLASLCISEMLRRKKFYFNEPVICFNSGGVVVSLFIFLFNFTKESLRFFKYYFFYIKKYLELAILINNFPVLFLVNFFKYKATSTLGVPKAGETIKDLVAVVLLYPSAAFLAERLVQLLSNSRNQQGNFDLFVKTFVTAFKKKKWQLIGLKITVKGRLGGSDRSRKFNFIEGQTSIKNRSNSLDFSYRHGVNDNGAYSVKVLSFFSNS